jgi:NTE family protein
MEFDLAFEGGGAKGAAFVGAWQELERRGHTARRFVGTSAGAVMAILVAAGYHAAELERAHAEITGMADFLDVPATFDPEVIRQSAVQELFDRTDLPLVPAATEVRLERALLDALMGRASFRMLFSLLELGGPFAGDRLRSWLTAKLEARHAGLGAATFAEFARITTRDLSITVSDVTGEEMLVLNARTAPACPVVWAVRASMSIPLVFQEVTWRPAWGRYRGRDLAGHVLVDGGVLSNFPIHLLPSKLGEVQEIMGDAGPAAVPNLGLLIDESLPVAGTVPDPRTRLTALFDLRALRRVQRIVETILNAHDRAVIDSCMARGEICRLPAGGYGALEFAMSDARRRAIIEAGRQAMSDYFDRAAP